jgi:hypothetical protein
MEKTKRLLIGFIAIVLVTAVAVWFVGKPYGVDAELIEIAGMIDGEAAFGHVEVLASDYYEGRLAGTAKCNEAADYIATKFYEYGLEPFGDDGTYFETFLVASYWLALNWSLEILSPEEITGLYDSNPMEYCASGNITAELVYVGLGGPDDYIGKNVTNKIAFILRGLYLIRDKVVWAYQHGARGVIIFDYIYEALAAFSGTLWEPQDIPAASLTREDGEKILEAMGFTITIDAFLDPEDISGTQLVFPTAHMYVDVVFEEDQPTRNVLGVIYGTEPSEYVLIGGHYDHLGPMKGEIYNGANDNAAGVAVVLELARVLSEYADEHPPRRSIIFAAWSAEEEGLNGSEYFIDTHQELLPQIKVVLNLDMPGAGEWVDGAPRNNMYIGDNPDARWVSKLVYDVSQLLIREGQIVLGANYTAPYYEKTGEYALYSGVDGIKVVEDSGSSDHEAFLLAGVPATVICAHARVADNYPEYHKPGDDAELIDPVKLEISGKLVGCSAWKVAQGADGTTTLVLTYMLTRPESPVASFTYTPPGSPKRRSPLTPQLHGMTGASCTQRS